MKTVSSLLAILLVAFSLQACSGGCLKTKEVKNLLNSKLSIGDTRERVEMALKVIDIQFTYDKFQNRYQATVRDERCGQFQAISVYLSFDESEKLSEIKVFESYTMP